MLSAGFVVSFKRSITSLTEFGVAMPERNPPRYAEFDRSEETALAEYFRLC